MDITNRYRMNVFGSYSECAITLDSAVFQSVNDGLPDSGSSRLDRSGDVASLITGLLGPPALGRAFMETRPAFRTTEAGTRKSECNSEVSVELDMDIEIRFEVPNAGAGTTPEDEKARRVIKIWAESDTISRMVEDGSIPDAVENLLRRSRGRGSGNMEANLDLSFEDLDDGRRRYVLPLGRGIDQQIEHSSGVLSRESRLVGQGDIVRLAEGLFPNNLNKRLIFGTNTNAGQMAMLRAYPYQDEGNTSEQVEIWFVAPDATRETIGGECRTEITMTGEKWVFPHESIIRTAHASLKGRTAAQPKAAEARELIIFQRPVFQPLLRYKDQASERQMQVPHSEGDVAVLLARTLGNGVLRDVMVTEAAVPEKGSEPAARPSYFDYFSEPPPPPTYNTMVAMHMQVDGGTLTLSFEIPHGSRARSMAGPKEALERRKLITISGRKETVARITQHPNFEKICDGLRQRNTAAINVYEDPANPSEFTIALARPVFQPRAELNGTLAPAEGDLTILFGRVFGGNATVEKSEWKTVFRSGVLKTGQWGAPDLFEPSGHNHRLVVNVDVGGRKLAVSIEVPKQGTNGTATPPIADLEARQAITIKGNPGLVRQVKDYPELEQIRAELNQRDMGATRERVATAAAPQESTANPAAPPVRAQPLSEEERRALYKKAGVVPMNQKGGRERVCFGLVKPPSDQPGLSIPKGVGMLKMKEKPRLIPGHGKLVVQPAPTIRRR